MKRIGMALLLAAMTALALIPIAQAGGGRGDHDRGGARMERFPGHHLSPMQGRGDHGDYSKVHRVNRGHGAGHHRGHGARHHPRHYRWHGAKRYRGRGARHDRGHGPRHGWHAPRHGRYKARSHRRHDGHGHRRHRGTMYRYGATFAIDGITFGIAEAGWR